MIDRLIAALRAPELELDLDWRDLADVLWLATVQQAAATQQESSGIAQDAASPEAATAEVAESAGPSTVSEEPAGPPHATPGAPRAWVEHPAGGSPQAPVRFGARNEPGLGLDVHAPVRHALPDREQIGRALRPFTRRRPSSRRREFDADATVSQFCDTGVLAPVMRPARERWFDVALVIDDGPTLVVWQETATALGDLLERHGAFRGVTRWHLGRDGSGQVCLRTPSGLRHSPSVLDDATDPSMVLVLTDCVGDLWSSDSGWSLLRDWGRTLPVAILQPLPERAWSHTWMGDADIAVRAHRPGQANATLEHSQPWWWDSDEPLTGAVPVVALDADSVGPWSRMVMGTPGVGVRAVSGRAEHQASALATVVADDAAPGPRLAELLRSGLSSTAYELAIHLSAVDLSVPIAHIVMDRVVPQAREEHLAELLVTGVLRVGSASSGATELTSPSTSLVFPDGVRETLQQSLTTTATLGVWRALVPHLEATGQQPRFSLVLDEPMTAAGTSGDRPAKASEEAGTEMRRIAAQVAARLGFEAQARSRPAPVLATARDIEPGGATEEAGPERPVHPERPERTELPERPERHEPPGDYLDFDVAITRDGAGYAVRAVSSRTGEASAPFVLPFDPREIADFLFTVGPAQAASGRRVPAAARVGDVKDFGRRLGDALLTGPVLDAYTDSLETARASGQDLRVTLRLDAVPELDPVPWEYAYDSRLERFLALSPQTPVVRLIDSAVRRPTVTVEPPLRVLVMISSPSDAPEFNVEQQRQLLFAATLDLVKSGQVAVTVLDRATLTALQRALLGDHDVFHFIGHGSFGDDAHEGAIVLEKEDGTSHRVPANRLGEMLMDARSMQLVVLMACEGARTSGRDGFPGVGQALVRQGLPAVVAMQTEISDRAALVFNHDFYAAAAQGLGTEAAISTVRLAMAASDQASEWGTPVLYRGSTDSWRLNITPPAEPNAHSVRVVGHTRAVTAVATARLEDGRPVAVTGSRDATVRVWDLQSGTTLGGALTGHTAEVTGVATAIMPDGSVVAVTGSRDATLRVWDLQSGTPLGAPFAGLDAVTAISTAVMPDGRVVAVAGGRDAQVRTWDLRTGRLIGKFVTGHTDRVTALATATLPDGRIAVVTSGFDPTVRVWELASGVPLREPLATGADTIWALATAELADGRLVAVAGADDGTVHVLDMQERSGANRLSGHTAAVEAAATAVLPSGRVVAVTGDRAGSLRAWDLHSMSVLGEPSTGHPEAIWALAGSSLRDGRTVAVAGRDDGTVEVVNLAYLESLPSPELDAVEVELGEAEPSAEAMQSSSDADAASESPSTGQAAQPKGRFRRLLDALGGRDRPAEAETQTPTPASSSTLTRTSRGTRTTNSSTETFTVDYTVSGQRLELVSGGRGAVKTTVGPLGSEQPRSFDGVVVTVGELLFESDEVVVRAIDQALSLDGGWREADSEASRFPTTRIAEQVGHIVGELTSLPVSDVLIGGWKQHEGLMEAADRTSGVPPTAEWIELGSHGIAWSRNPSFTVSLDSQTVFTGELDIHLELEVEALTLLIVDGRVMAVDSGTCHAHVSATVSARGGPRVLLAQSSRSFPVRGVLPPGDGMSLRPS